MLTHQEIFDRVATHLLKQGDQSFILNCNNQKVCRYRNSSGLKCAIGCLIEDDEYKEVLEGYTAFHLLRSRYFKNFNNDHKELLIRLQGIHDGCCPSEWKSRLSALAAEFGLEKSSILS